MRLRLIGAGTIDDPYRVDVPTYVLVDADPHAGAAVVDVPDADVPDELAHRAILAAPTFDQPRIRARRRTVALDAWYAHLDSRYAEHAGRFRPQIA